MSYIKHRDRVFLKKGRNAVKKRSDCNLRRISSCSDVRAWSMSAEEQRQYFLDNITSKSRSSLGKYIPPDVIVDILKKQNSVHLKKLSSLKRWSSEDLIKKKESLNRKRSRISVNLDKARNSESDLGKPIDDFELNNLRTMVKDLEGKLTAFKRLEDENCKLKAQIHVGIEKIESVEEIGPLVAKQYIGFPRNEKVEQLSDAIDIMRNQCNKMRLNVEYLQTKNCKLISKLKRSSSCERALKNRQLCVSLETVNNAILKSKVSCKDLKIQRLQSLNEEQKTHIESLASHIKELTIHYSWKEEMLVGKLVEFKDLVKRNHDKVVICENQLSLCQNVIQEMEILRDHFRMVNGALKEEALYYKNRLRTIADKVLEMACKIEYLLREVAKRDAKINELTKFPGRSAMAIRLAQLDSILHGDFLYHKNKNGVVETFERLKTVLKDLKKDAWDSYGLDHPISYLEGSCQTLIEYSECGMQADPAVFEIEIQTVFPDDYVVKFITYIIFINMFNIIVRKMKLYLKKKELTHRNLKIQITELNQTLSEKDVYLETLDNRNKNLQYTIDTLNNQLNQGRSNTATVLKSSEFIIDACESLNNIFNETLSITAKEYNDYCDLLEGIIESNEEKLDELAEYVENEIGEQRWQHFRYLSELEKKNDLLTEALTKETKINSILSREIDALIIDLDERDGFISKIKDSWFKAECEKTELAKILSTRDESFDASCQIRIDLSDNEVMTDLELNKLLLPSFDKMVEANIELPSTKNWFCQRTFKNNWTHDKNLKKKMSLVNVKVKKIRIRIVNLKNRLELSVDSLKKLKESNISLTEINKNITLENHKLKSSKMKLREVISNLRIDLKNESSKNNTLQDNQVKFFHDFQRIQSELFRLKDTSNKIMSENSINTDVTMSDFEHLLCSKDECIQQLKERIEKLLDLLKEIEEEKKIKENNAVSRCSQCDVDNSVEEHYQKLLKDIKENYEDITNNLKKEFAKEKDTKEKYYRNNLSLLKDTYERDIKRIKVANAESLRKIQTFHEDEIRAIRRSLVEAKSKSEPINSSFIHEKHSTEMEQLRIDYEMMMKEKSDIFMKEKEQLQEELRKYMSEKEDQVEEITRRMEIGMKNMKKKCKQHMKKLQKENCCALDELRKQYNIGKVDDMSSIDMSDMCSLTHDKDFSIVESEDIQCAKDECDTYFEANTDTSGFDDDQYDCVIVDERRFLLKRIEQLEDQLSEKVVQSSENACDSEKRVWVEKEKCREISRLLDKEMERNEKLRKMLKNEKSRAEKLVMVNQALLEKLQSMELRNQDKVADSYRVNDKEQMSNKDYDELFDSYDSSIKSEIINSCGQTNFKYL